MSHLVSQCPFLSKLSSHLRTRIGEIRRRLSSPPIPLYSSFVWSHLPERPCPKFRHMTYTIPPTISFFNSSLNNASSSSISHLAIESSTERIYQRLPSFLGLGVSWSYLAFLLLCLKSVKISLGQVISRSSRCVY